MNRTFNPKRLFAGAFIPNWLLCRTEITMSAKVVYGRLLQYCNDDGLAWPKIATIAQEVGLSSRQCIRILGELEQTGLIQVVRRGESLSNEYSFLWHEWISESCEQSPVRGDIHDTGGGDIHDRGGVTYMSLPYNKEGKEQKKRTIRKDIDVPIPEFLRNNHLFVNSWESWLSHRKEKKKPLTESTAKLQLKFLSTQPDPIACIEQSIFHGWEGLFAVKAPIQNPKQLTSKEISKLPNARDVRRVV